MNLLPATIGSTFVFSKISIIDSYSLDEFEEPIKCNKCIKSFRIAFRLIHSSFVFKSKFKSKSTIKSHLSLLVLSGSTFHLQE